jgi:hypothetical protein
MPVPLRRLCQVEERLRFDWQRLGRLLEGAFREIQVRAAHQERAPQKRERVARLIRSRETLQRAEGLGERHTAVDERGVPLGGLEPHPAEGNVDGGMIWIAFARLTESEDRVLEPSGIRIRAAERDLAGGAGMEREQRFELLDAVAVPPEAAVQICELLTRLRHRRRELDGPLDGRERRPRIPRVA